MTMAMGRFLRDKDTGTQSHTRASRETALGATRQGVCDKVGPAKTSETFSMAGELDGLEQNKTEMKEVRVLPTTNHATVQQRQMNGDNEPAGHRGSLRAGAWPRGRALAQHAQGPGFDAPGGWGVPRH